jgi:hypothetical protein
MAIVENRHWILLALVTGAAVSYGVGFMVGLGLFVAAGVIFELAFWLELFKSRHGLIRRFLKARKECAPEKSSWRCHACRESNPVEFEFCWSCGHSADGQSDAGAE